MEPNFALRITGNGNGVVVQLAGELDLATAGELEQCLRDVIGDTITLDCSDLTFMDSRGVSVIVAAHQRFGDRGDRIVLHGVRPAQMRVFQLLGLGDVLDFDGHLPEARPTG